MQLNASSMDLHIFPNDACDQRLTRMVLIKDDHGKSSTHEIISIDHKRKIGAGRLV